MKQDEKEMAPPGRRPAGWKQSLAFFAWPSLLFIGVGRLLIPAMVGHGIHPALAWFMGGGALFFLLFSLAIWKTSGEKGSISIAKHLRLNPLKKRDVLTALAGTLAIFLLMILLKSVWEWMAGNSLLPPLETKPSFIRFEAFKKDELWLFLPWSLMFFFNIAGEELLWRGYFLPRQEKMLHSKAWLANSLGWMLFHIVFGYALLILLVPILIILPYCVQRTGNTWVGILIHALVNGPSFIFIALGFS